MERKQENNKEMAGGKDKPAVNEELKKKRKIKRFGRSVIVSRRAMIKK